MNLVFRSLLLKYESEKLEALNMITLGLNNQLKGEDNVDKWIQKGFEAEMKLIFIQNNFTSNNYSIKQPPTPQEGGENNGVLLEQSINKEIHK